MVLSVVVLVTGCSGRTSVSGKLSYQGKPLPYGTVMIFGSDGMPQNGVIAADGVYTVSGVPYGPAKMVVTCIDPQAVEEAKKLAGRSTGGKRPSFMPFDDSKYSKIPLAYGDLTRELIQFNVDRGPYTFDLELKDVR